MPFKPIATASQEKEETKTPSAPTATQETKTAPASHYNLGAAVEELELALVNESQESIDLAPDEAYLEPEMITALSEVAEVIGFDYDPATTGTFRYVYREGSGNLYGPALVTDTKTCILRWGDKSHAIANDTETATKKIKLFVSEKDCYVVLDATKKGHRLRAGVITTKECREDKYSDIQFADEFGELVPFLRTSFPRKKLTELEDGTEITFTLLSNVVEPTDEELKEGENAWGTLVAEIEGSDPFECYCPGEVSFWIDKDYPISATKEGATLTLSDDTTAQLYVPMRKISELTPGDEPYVVTGYEAIGGKYPGYKITILIDDQPETFKANSPISKVLDTSPDISPEEPADLHVDKLRDGKDSNGNKIKIASVRFQPQAMKQSPALRKLRAKIKKQNVAKKAL